jgi:hypothetical protein
MTEALVKISQKVRNKSSKIGKGQTRLKLVRQNLHDNFGMRNSYYCHLFIKPSSHSSKRRNCSHEPVK